MNRITEIGGREEVLGPRLPITLWKGYAQLELEDL